MADPLWQVDYEDNPHRGRSDNSRRSRRQTHPKTMKSWVTNQDGSVSIEGPAPLKGSYHFWKNAGMLFWEVKGWHRSCCGTCFKKADARRAIKKAFREASRAETRIKSND